MSTIASVHIDTWGDKFVVVAEFDNLLELSTTKYATYSEALQEMTRVLQREKLRHEFGLGNNPSR